MPCLQRAVWSALHQRSRAPHVVRLSGQQREASEIVERVDQGDNPGHRVAARARWPDAVSPFCTGRLSANRNDGAVDELLFKVKVATYGFERTLEYACPGPATKPAELEGSSFQMRAGGRAMAIRCARARTRLRERGDYPLPSLRHQRPFPEDAVQAAAKPDPPPRNVARSFKPPFLKFESELKPDGNPECQQALEDE